MAKKSRSKWEQALLELLPVIAGFLFIISFRSELIIAVAVLLAIAVTFKIRYNKGEFALLLLGIATGTATELGADVIYKLQYWAKGSLFGIPLWLPLIWGYGFVLIRRLGNLVVKN